MKRFTIIFITILLTGVGSHTICAANPNELVVSLINNVKCLNLQQGIENSLLSKLEAAQKGLLSTNQNHYKNSVKPLEAFKNEVRAQRGKHIPEYVADIFLSQADSIIRTILGTAAKGIGTAGGSVLITDKSSEIYGTSVSVPPGALTSPTLITIVQEPNPPPMPTNLLSSGPAVTFGPEGTNFSTPVTIAIPYEEQQGIDENSLKLFTLNEIADSWIEITVNSRDIINNILYTPVSHFSTFQVGGEPPPEQVDPDAPHFDFVVVWSQTTSTGNELFLATSVIDKNGSVPSTIKSLTVEGPNNFSYKFSYLDYYFDIPLGKGIYRVTLPITNPPMNGDYTFRVEDNEGKETTRIKTLSVMPIPIVNKSTFNPPDRADSGTVTTTPTLSWNPVFYEKPVYYRVFIYNQNRSVIYRSPRVTSNQFVIPHDLLHENAIYYWRVEAFDADNGLVASNVSRSDIAIFATGSLSLTNSPIFESPRVWTDNDVGRKPYFLHIGGQLRRGLSGPFLTCQEIRDSNFNITVTDPNGQTITIPTGSFPVPGQNPPILSAGCYDLYSYFSLDIDLTDAPNIPTGEYVFTAVDGSGNQARSGDFFNEIKKLPAPVQIVPNDNSILNLTPTFIWEPVEGARTYQISIDGWIGGQRIRVFDSPHMTDTAYKYTISDPVLQSNIQYWWRVRAFDGRYFSEIDNRSTGSWRRFTVDPNAPYFNWVSVWNDSYPPPIGTYNLNLAAMVKDPNGLVNNSSDNTIASLTVSGPDNFSYEFNPKTPFFYIPLNDWIYASPLIPGAPVNGRYTFQVTDTEGKTGIAYKDLLVNPVPIVEKSSFNIPDGTQVPIPPTLSWSPVTDSRTIYYRVRITDFRNTIIYDSPLTQQTSITVPQEILLNGQTYNWRVQAFDAPTPVEASNRSNSAWANFYYSTGDPVSCTGVYDDFDGANINTALWYIYDSCKILSQSGGYLHGGGPPYSCYGWLHSKRVFDGDFEFVLEYSGYLFDPGESGVESGPRISLQANLLSGGDHVGIVFGGTTHGMSIGSGARINGEPREYTYSPTQSTDGALKIVRNGNIITTYYKEGDQWVLLGNFSDAFTGPVYASVQIYSGDGGECYISSDKIYAEAQSCY